MSNGNNLVSRHGECPKARRLHPLGSALRCTPTQRHEGAVQVSNLTMRSAASILQCGWHRVIERVLLHLRQRARYRLDCHALLAV